MEKMQDDTQEKTDKGMLRAEDDVAPVAFWGGPWNGRIEMVPVRSSYRQVLQKDYSMRSPVSFSAALDYVGNPYAEFPDEAANYLRFDGEFVDEKLLRDLRPKGISDVLRHLASRPIRCHYCDKIQVAPQFTRMSTPVSSQP